MAIPGKKLFILLGDLLQNIFVKRQYKLIDESSMMTLNLKTKDMFFLNLIMTEQNLKCE
jgi:hypothetical protein